MGWNINGKRQRVYRNGKLLRCWRGGELILGIVHSLEIDPNPLNFEGSDSGNSYAKTATITGGQPPYLFVDAPPSWLSATIDGHTITVYPTSSAFNPRTCELSIKSPGTYTRPGDLIVTQAAKLAAFGIVGNNGNIEIIDVADING
jgi:hypothetical protein